MDEVFIRKFDQLIKDVKEMKEVRLEMKKITCEMNILRMENENRKTENRKVNQELDT